MAVEVVQGGAVILACSLPGRGGSAAAAGSGDHLRCPAVQDVQALGGDPVFGGGVAGGVEAPGGLPQVLDDVDEVDQDRDLTSRRGGLGGDHVDLVVVAVHQRDPGPGVAGVAALGLVEQGGDGLGAADGDLAVYHRFTARGPSGRPGRGPGP